MSKIKKKVKKFNKEHLTRVIKERKSKPKFKKRSEKIPVDKKNIEEEIKTHKTELEALKENDLEFYEFLKANDKDLLEFEEDQEEEEEEENLEDIEDEDILGEEERLDADSPLDDEFLTIDMFNTWIKKSKTSTRYLKKVLLAFRSAAHANDDDTVKKSLLKINEEQVFSHVIVTSMKTVGPAFNEIFSTSSKQLPTSSPKWSKYQKIVKSFVSNVVYLMKQLTSASLLEFMLKELDKSQALAYFACFSKTSIIKDFFKVLLKLWSNNKQSDDADDESTLKILSFLTIRRLMNQSPPSFIPQCLKRVYSEFNLLSKHTSNMNLSHINFMSNCVVELYSGVDSNISYQLMFVFLRQMAIFLRNSIIQAEGSDNASLNNWQIVNSINLWTRVIGTTGRDSTNPLQELAFPLIQICLGICKNTSTPKDAPLRLHIIKALVFLGKRLHRFIPLSPLVLDILQDANTSLSKSKPSTSKPLDLGVCLRIPKGYQDSRITHEQIADESLELLIEYLASFQSWISFPEVVIIPVVELKKMSKGKNVKLNKQIASLLEKIDLNNKKIMELRDKVDFGPSDREKANSFMESVVDTGELPLGKYWQSIQKISIQKKKLIAESK